ncbi:MAG: archease [Verrucomicrobiae bacterium]|nr:archease [Verrucomicrobiae bacterium]
MKAPQEETERPGESQTGEAELEICDGVKLMDHAADAGLIITARTMRELFERAAMGMFLLLMDLSAVRPVQSESIRLTAEDAEILLVSWLSELNYRHVVRRMVYCRFHVSELDGVKLAATVSGEKLDRARHTIHTEIKAITRHGLKIVTTDKGYRAEVLFDL